MSEILIELKKFPFLAGIDEGEMKDLAGMMQKCVFEAGADIITEGDTGQNMYLLTDGTVDVIGTTVFGETYVCSTLDSSMHCVFGEMALIDSDRRSATVRARTGCEALSIDKAAFDRYVSLHPATGVVLLKVISANLVRNLRKENENLQMVYQALIDEIENA